MRVGSCSGRKLDIGDHMFSCSALSNKGRVRREMAAARRIEASWTCRQRCGLRSLSRIRSRQFRSDSEWQKVCRLQLRLAHDIFSNVKSEKCSRYHKNPDCFGFLFSFHPSSYHHRERLGPSQRDIKLDTITPLGSPGWAGLVFFSSIQVSYLAGHFLLSA